MKTYLVPIHGKYLAWGVTQANNKEQAFKKVKAKHKDACKTGVSISGIHISLVKPKKNFLIVK